MNGEFTLWPSLVVGIIVAGVSLAVDTHGSGLEIDVALASMATFLFGVLLAFTIARARERLQLLQDTISTNNAALLSIHQMMVVFPEREQLHIRELIDLKLTSEIDYRLVDNHLATPAHLDLAHAIYALEPLNQEQIGVYRELLRICIDVGANRAIVESITGQSLSALEWSGMLLLLILLIGLIAVIPGGTVLGAIAAGVLAGTLATLMVLLRKLDQLRWHERVSIWEPTTRLFRSMGLDPYVPRVAIDSGRYRPTGRIRVVDYPDPYPERSTKIVTVEVLGRVATGGRLQRGIEFAEAALRRRRSKEQAHGSATTEHDVSTVWSAASAGAEAQHPLSPYFPRLVIDWITNAPEERHQERVGTIAFVDISGFTKLSEGLARHGKVGAEELTATIGTCFVSLLDLAVAYGGRLLKFGGDALLLFFAGEAHEARACRAAIEMRRALREVGRLTVLGQRVALRMSVGVHSGLFHFFLVGGSHREFIVAGPGASTVVTMEGTADAGEIVLSPQTAAALRPADVGLAKGPGFLLRRAPRRPRRLLPAVRAGGA